MVIEFLRPSSTVSHTIFEQGGGWVTYESSIHLLNKTEFLL